MIETKKKQIEIYNDTLNIFEIFLSTVFYTIALFVIIYYFYLGFECGFTFDWFKISPSFISVFCSFLVPAVKNSEVNILSVSEDNSQINHVYKVGVYQKTKSIYPEEIQYVAINKNIGYTVTLWYYENGYKNFQIATYYKKDKAFNHSKILAKALKIDVLDKIDEKNPIWIENKNL